MNQLSFLLSVTSMCLAVWCFVGGCASSARGDARVATPVAATHLQQKAGTAMQPANNPQNNPPNNPVGYFEIPVSNMQRAIAFYERVLLTNFELTEIDGHPMALFPFDAAAPGITGALAHGNSYQPGPQGVRIYFGVTDIDATLARAVEAGGKVLYPKTSIGEHGFVAEFEDSEGNAIAVRMEAR